MCQGGCRLCSAVEHRASQMAAMLAVHHATATLGLPQPDDGAA